jgi:Terminase small subunit
MWRAGNQAGNLFMAGPLQNLRWERFSREYASGESLVSAYKRAGFDRAGKYAKFNASRLRNKPAVKARIDELMEQFAERTAVGVEYLQHQLLPLLRVNAQDLYGPGGRLRPVADLEREIGAAIKSIKYKDGTISEVVLADKIAAAGMLLRSIGIGDGTSVNVAAIAASGEITDDDRKKALAALFAKFKAKAEAVPLVESDPAPTRQANETASPVKEIVEENVVDYNNYRYDL